MKGKDILYIRKVVSKQLTSQTGHSSSLEMSQLVFEDALIGFPPHCKGLN